MSTCDTPRTRGYTAVGQNIQRNNQSQSNNRGNQMKAEHSFQQKRQQWREAVRKDTRLTAGQRLVLTALDEFRNRTRDNAWPTNETLGEACGVSRQTANGALKRAEELGYLVAVSRPRRHDGRQGAVVWKFNIPRNPESSTVDTGHLPESSTVDTGERSRVKHRIAQSQARLTENPRRTPEVYKPPSEPTEDAQHIEDLKMRLGLL